MSTKCKKTLGGRGSAPDPDGRAYLDLLDVVDVNVPVLLKDFVGRLTVRMNCLEALSLEY